MTKQNTCAEVQGTESAKVSGSMTEKNKWWDNNFTKLINYVSGADGNTLFELFKNKGLTDVDISAELNGTSKHISLSLLNIYSIEEIELICIVK